MVRRPGKKFFAGEEEDPMAGTSNLVDAMLVIAVGLLIFLIISWNMQGAILDEAQSHQQEKQETVQQNVTEVSQGQDLNNTPDVSESSGNGYTELGKVYKDPSTGKLIMVQ